MAFKKQDAKKRKMGRTGEMAFSPPKELQLQTHSRKTLGRNEKQEYKTLNVLYD